MNHESEDTGRTQMNVNQPKRRFPPWLDGPNFLSSLIVIWKRKWRLGFEPNKQKCDKHARLIKWVELNHAIGLKASLPQRYGSFLKQSASNCSTPWKHNTDEEAQISTAVTMIMFSFISFQKTIHLIKRAVYLPISLFRKIRLVMVLEVSVFHGEFAAPSGARVPPV